MEISQKSNYLVQADQPAFPQDSFGQTPQSAPHTAQPQQTQDNHNQNAAVYGQFGRRAIAMYLDSIIIGIAANILITPLVFLFRIEALYEIGMTQLTSTVSFFLLAVYNVYMWVNFEGATIGKKIMKLKIISSDNTPITYKTAIIRYLSTCISAIVFGLGYLNVFWDEKRQSWHDKIARTFVIKTN